LPIVEWRAMRVCMSLELDVAVQSTTLPTVCNALHRPMQTGIYDTVVVLQTVCKTTAVNVSTRHCHSHYVIPPFYPRKRIISILTATNNGIKSPRVYSLNSQWHRETLHCIIGCRHSTFSPSTHKKSQIT